jgi:hypothetical protein
MDKPFLQHQAQWKVKLSCVKFCFLFLCNCHYISSPCAYDLFSNWTLLALWFVLYIHIKNLQTIIPRKLSCAPIMM